MKPVTHDDAKSPTPRAGRPANKRARSETSDAADSSTPLPSVANQERRRQIIEVATQLFWEKGFDSTTTREIGDEVGLLKGSLYYYVNSKEDLLLEIVGDVHQEGLRRVEELRELDDGPLVKLRLFIERGIVFATQHVRELRIFFNDGRSLSPERQSTLRDKRTAYDNYLRELIAAAQEEGEVCPDVDAHGVATAVVGVINWTAYWYRTGGDLSAQQLASEYADLILNGLSCRARSHTPGHRRRVGAPKRKSTKRQP